MIAKSLDLLFHALHQERDRRNDIISHKFRIDNFSCGYLPLIYKHWVCKLFTKMFKIMFISTKVHKPYVCDLLGLYALLVRNSLDLITFIGKPY